MLRKHFKYLAPEQEEGVAGAPAEMAGAATPSETEPTLTQKEVDAREAKMRRKYERELAKRDKAFEALNAKFGVIEERLEAATASENAPAPTDVAGKLELFEKKYDRDRQEWDAKLAEATRQAAQERSKRLELMRDTRIQDALTAAGVSDSNRIAATRYFLPDVHWDDLEEDWVLITKSGNPVSLMEGIAEGLPDIFKPARMSRGGAGTPQTGVGAAKLKAQRELDEEKKKLDALSQRVSNGGGRQNDVFAWQKQKRRVAQLEAALQN